MVRGEPRMVMIGTSNPSRSKNPSCSRSRAGRSSEFSRTRRSESGLFPARSKVNRQEQRISRVSKSNLAESSLLQHSPTTLLPPLHYSNPPSPLLHHSSSSANRFDHRQCIPPGPHRQKNRVAMLATQHNDHNIFGRGGEMYDSVRRHVRRFP